jgi:hypothetical protein
MHDFAVDAEYAWGRPVTTYLSPYQHIRLIAWKSKLEASGALYALRARAASQSYAADEMLSRIPRPWSA